MLGFVVIVVAVAVGWVILAALTGRLIDELDNVNKRGK